MNPLIIRPQTFISRLVTIIVVIFVFEEAIYGRLSLSATSYLIAKIWTEAFLYFFLLLVFLHQSVQGRLPRYRPTGFDFCMAAFLVAAALSTVINHGSLVQGAINVRTMLRYMAVYYIIVAIGWVPTERQMILFLKLLVGIALVQSLLITVQHIAGDTFRDAYFSPPTVEVVVSGVSKILGQMNSKLGAGYGTFGKTSLAAFYLLFVAVITVAVAMTGRYGSSWRWWVAYAIILIGIYFSYKRAPLLLALLVPILVAWVCGRKHLVRRYLAVGIIVVPLALMMLSILKPEGYVKEKNSEISPAASIAQLFSKEYWAVSSTKSRGWMIMEVGRQALVSFKPLGYGADEEHAKAVLATKGGEFGKLAGWGAFDDVYIVATLVYYGPVGVALVLSAFYFIYRRGRVLARMASPHFAIVGTSLMAIMIMMLLAVFVERLLEFRAFVFLFWVFAGVSVTASRSRGNFLSNSATNIYTLSKGAR